ncbi:MAG: hypothetical protein QXT73_00330 [Candidatus Methanomethylicaceae archaeon]
MRHENLPAETRKILSEVLNRSRERKVPDVGDCFFLDVPTSRPRSKLDHILAAAIGRRGDALICAKISLEYWNASEYDYMLDPDEWSAGYPVIVEVWNSILLKLPTPMLIHASITTDSLEAIRSLFSLHQKGQRPPKDLPGIGKPLPDNPRHQGWKFRAKEARMIERARKKYHEK